MKPSALKNSSCHNSYRNPVLSYNKIGQIMCLVILVKGFLGFLTDALTSKSSAGWWNQVAVFPWQVHTLCWGAGMLDSAAPGPLNGECPSGKAHICNVPRGKATMVNRQLGSRGWRSRWPQDYRVHHSNILPPPSHMYQGFMSMTVQRCQVLVFLANPKFITQL